jgi:hypothetical protein
VILHDPLLTAIAVGTTVAGLIAFASQLVVITEVGSAAVVALEPTTLEHVEGRDARLG